MPKIGFYAVRVGREIGVYNNWQECKKQTEGYPNARYKRFDNMKAAEEFVSTTPVIPYSDTRSSSEGKGKKRVHAKIEDERCWDVVYTDGACKGNGKVGSVAGIGIWWGHGDPRNIAERCPGDQTNNRAELIAILRVLETTPLSKRPLLIKTDSAYSIDCFDRWIRRWIRNNWKTASGKPVKNEGIIRCIDSHLEIRSRSGQKVRLQHVKGHSGEVGNDGADSLANEGTLGPSVQECDWKSLEAGLVKVLDSIVPNTAELDQGSFDIAVPTLEPHPKSRKLADARVPFRHQLDKAPIMGTTDMESDSSAYSLVGTQTLTQTLTPYHGGVAEVERSGRFDKLSSASLKFTTPATPTKPRTVDETGIQISPDMPRLTGNAIKPAVPVLESICTKRMGPIHANVSSEQPVRLSIVVGEADLHVDVSSEQPVRLSIVVGEADLHVDSSTSRSLELEGSSKTTPHATHDFHANSSSQSPVKVLYAAPPLVPVRVEDVNFEDYADCVVDDADLALELSD